MKRASIFLFIFSILFGCATVPPKTQKNQNQKENLDGCLGIAWEENTSNAVSILNKNNIKIVASIGDEYIQAEGRFAEGEFIDEDDMLFLLWFFDDRFYAADIRPEAYNKRHSLEFYNAMNNLLTDRYGKPSYVSNNIEMTSYWYFGNNCIISTNFKPGLNLFNMRYVNGTILKIKDKY